MTNASDIVNDNGTSRMRCEDPFDVARLLRATVVASVAMLALLTLVVVVGNSLVVIAVFKSRKLRTTTNNFVVSLACADLLVGVMVLPLSGANEVLHYWPFGRMTCSVWLAVDVWTCTSSILHLCAISLDRYLAIGYPFKYPTLMSPRRSRILVGAVWVSSFIICFPPLIGWKESDSELVEGSNITSSNGDITPTKSAMFNETDTRRCAAPPQCMLTSDSGYVIYSALGSFWIPMLVMAFFYWRIYRTAVRTTVAMKRGVLTKKSLGSTNNVTLRIHRGGTSTRSSDIHCNDRLLGGSDAPASIALQNANVSIRLKNTKGDTSSSATSESANSTLDHVVARQQRHLADDASRTADVLGSCRSLASSRNGHRLAGKMSYIKVHLKKMNKERKAAKTVGIIVGCFILCWLPFFTVYLTGAFCKDCISPVVFTVFFWLGYCNSAMNPFVYAFFSRDFRFAFKRLLRCDCRRQRGRSLSRFNTGQFLRSSTKNSDSLSE